MQESISRAFVHRCTNSILSTLYSVQSVSVQLPLFSIWLYDELMEIFFRIVHFLQVSYEAAVLKIMMHTIQERSQLPSDDILKPNSVYIKVDLIGFDEIHIVKIRYHLMHDNPWIIFAIWKGAMIFGCTHNECV